MPPVNHAVLASVGIVAASVAVAAAIAIYEIPEVRRAAEDLRRRIAIALHSLGDNVDPNRPPRFNRPEDAEGFYQTHDVDADEETRRRQREELMYWNMRREEQKQRESQHSRQSSRGSTFDDFLKPDQQGENGTYVYNSGAATWDPESSNVLRRRGGNADGARALNASLYANPFGDEHGIELEDHAELAPPARDEIMSDIYNATPLVRSAVFVSPPPYAELPVPAPVPVPAAAAAAASEVLFDFAAHAPPSAASTAVSEQKDLQHTTQPQQEDNATSTSRSTTLDRELADDEYMTAGQDDRTAADAYASIQAWAQHSSSSHHHDNDNTDSDSHHNGGFYSPLPSTPRAPVSEPEVISAGQLTPADSASVAGWSIAEAESRHEDGEGHGGREADVLSESEGEEGGGGVHTPGSWSEVGSVVSESESAVRA